MVRWPAVHDAGGVNVVVSAGVWKFKTGETWADEEIVRVGADVGVGVCGAMVVVYG